MQVLNYDLPLEQTRFQKRYKRFFVDVKKLNGDNLTVHCANSGSMKSCMVENAPAFILDSQNYKRKLSHTLELLLLEDGYACVNTLRANQFIHNLFLKFFSNKYLNFFAEKQFPIEFFSRWNHVKSEVKFGSDTRFDFCLSTSASSRKCWVEVKSVSLKIDDETWAFPDAVTIRGQKHLRELMHAREMGDDAWLFFVLMRGSQISEEKLAKGFRAAKEIDQNYSELLELAKKTGVKVALVIPNISPIGFGLRMFKTL